MTEGRHRIRLVGPTLLIGIGIVLLLSNMGYLEWSVWDLLRLWPVLLIAGGLELLIGHRSALGAIVAALLALASVIGGVWLISTQGAPTGTRQEFSYPRNDMTAARVRIAPAVAQLHIGALEDSAAFVEGALPDEGRSPIEQSFTGGSLGRLSLATADGASGGVYPTLAATQRWDLSFSPRVALDLDIDMAMGEAHLDLSRLTVDQAAVDFGMGMVTLELPTQSSADLTIDGGIGQVVINAPEGVGVRIRDEAGLVAKTVPAGYVHNGNVYESPGYKDAERQVTLRVSLGIGSLHVRER